MIGKRFLVCSFHDLAPNHRAACERFLQLLHDNGIPRAVLLVVPRWHDRDGLDPGSTWAAWLRARQAEGHEICLHGWTHRADRIGRDPTSWIFGRVYTAGENEFHRLPLDEAEKRVRRGLAMLRVAGLNPRGFIAPAWLMPRKLLPLLKDLGLEYTVTLTHLHFLQKDTSRVAPVLALSARAPWRRGLSVLHAAAASCWMRPFPILRVAAHPADFEHAATIATLGRAIRAAVRNRTVVTFEALTTSSAA